MHNDEFLKQLEDSLDQLLVTKTDQSKQRLSLPNAYFVASNEPVAGFNMPHMYYWDSYFICQGLKNGKYRDYDIGIAENCFSLIERLGFVPNSNSYQNLSRSQPPLLAKLVEELIDEGRVDVDWQRNAYFKLKEEYENVWVNNQQPHIRKVHTVLSRYYDSNALNSLAEAESGWDYTNRFNNRALDYLPIDLNSYLAIYERLLARLAADFDDGAVNDFEQTLRSRVESINQLHWSNQEGFYFDYDYKNGSKGTVRSLAAYSTMFCGVASNEQARSLVDQLRHFETENGLACTQLDKDIELNKQWTAPNGWAPLHFIVVEGLDSYGFSADAKRIAGKWIELVKAEYEKSSRFLEKYNIVDPSEKPLKGLYPDQIGFGWTNAVTKYFIEKYF